jgi:hypothetical protein
MDRKPSNAALAARDLAVVWHPCTQMQDHQRLPMIPIARGEGVWLEDFDGRRYLDGISSWWVNLFGHANPRINTAVREQLERLEHVLLAGFTHETVLQLSERLVRLLPAGLTRCFYADNGSAAVEVSVKMAFHYWQNRGQPRKRRFVVERDRPAQRRRRVVERELEPRGELHGAQHAETVVAEGGWIHDAQDAAVEVLSAAEGILEPILERIPPDGVDGEVAPARRLLERHRGVALHLEPLVPAPLLRLAAGQRHVDVSSARRHHLVHGEALPDRLHPAELFEDGQQAFDCQAEHFEVDVLRRPSEQPVAHPPADQERPAPGRMDGGRQRPGLQGDDVEVI